MTESTILLPYPASGKEPSQTPWLTAEMSDLAQICVGTAQRIAELNSRAIDATINEQRAVALETAGERSPFGAWRLQASFALAGTAKAAAYWRHVNEIMVDAVVEAVNEAEGCLNRNFVALSAALGAAATDVSAIVLASDPPAASGAKENEVQIVDPHGNAVAPRRSE
ncbi:phasin family protein [Paraburkholderia sp. CNPSo 3274]|uniref:phasin family protein n=1 Tax=Paraburkholderia sp. CNPSo 3274 TaxID=2940932 RepID=UPI0020B8DCE3|nr:phasin family protein [Paraburkholderia sp. CNPSo 3274]MCP3712512.1 phasin family protein [Paraburkholderia sp. CNPSo 3274]